MGAQKEYRVTGAITSKVDGRPLPGVKVGAYDKDFFRDQLLGTDTTDETGSYEIRFGRDSFTGPLVRLERAPDVFIEVAENGHLLATTEESIVVDAGRDIRVDVAVPYGEKPVPAAAELVAGEPVNLVAAAQLSAAELVAIYQYANGRAVSLKNRELAELAFPTLLARHRPSDDCGLGRGASVLMLLQERGVLYDAEELGDDLPPGATVNWFYTANVRVKYTTDAAFPADAVDPTTPASDMPYQLPNGGPVVGTLRSSLAGMDPANTVVAPTYVQKVGLLGEYALSKFVAPPFNFRDPRAGAARFEYRIRGQSAGIAGRTQPAWSYVEVDNNNSDDQNAGTVPHEMFHQVQFRYNGSLATSGSQCLWAVAEGGARFIEDSISDPRNRYVLQAQDIYDTPGGSLLDVGGLQNPRRYAFALLWKYIAEQHSPRTNPPDEPAIGIDAHRIMLEKMATALPSDPGAGYTVGALRAARQQMPWYGSLDQFGYYDAAATELSSHETTWGNYLVANWLHGTANPTADRRFDYMEDEDPVGYTGLGAAGRLALRNPAVLAGDAVSLSQGTSVTKNVTGQNPWAARYFTVTPTGSPAPRLLRITFTASGGMSDPLVQVLRLGPGSALVDVHRSDKATYAKTVNLNGLEKVVVIVGSRDNGGNYTLQFDEVASASDVMVTRWNTAVGTEYEMDPRGYTWTWVSPDVMVDNNDDGLADTSVFFGTNNKLKVRLRNRGNLAVSNITIDFWYRKATPALSAWLPVQNTAMVTQQVTGGTLLAGEAKWFAVDWAPVNDGSGYPHWCVKVKVTVSGDPNADNKLTFSNFSHVVVGSPDTFDLVLRVRDDVRTSRLAVVPRGPRWTLAVEREPRFGGHAVAARCECDGDNSSTAVAANRAGLAVLRPVPARLRAWDRRTRTLEVEPETYYPVAPDSLPPGVEPESLVTVAHWVDGRVVGGVTYQLEG